MSSYLCVHCVKKIPRNSGLRKCNNERSFVAIRELHAIQTVSPYLMRQLFFVQIRKTELSEKIGLVGEHKYPLCSERRGFGQALADKRGSDAALRPVFPYCERAYLCKAVPAYMERTHARDDPVFLEHQKIAQMLVQLVQRTRQHLARLGILIDERLYRLYIGYHGLAYHTGKITLFRKQSQ